MTVLVTIIAILFICIIIAAILRSDPVMWDDEEEVVTTTTTTTTTTVTDPAPAAPVDDTIYVVGNLKRSFEGNQPFVLDPVDGEKIWLNTKDDLYEDVDGKVWKLV